MEGQERENRIAVLRAEVHKGEVDACQPTPTILENSRRLAASHADFLTRIADWTEEKQRREEEYEDYRVAQAEAVPMTIHEMVQVDPGNFYQRQKGFLDEAAMKLEARKAEEVQRAVAEVKNAPAINVRSAALAAETRGPLSANHAEALLAWGVQASERKERKRQELEASLRPPPSPAINANSKRLAAKWEKTQEERRRKKKLLAEEEASAEVTFKPTINKRRKEWRPSSAPSGGRHSRLNVSAELERSEAQIRAQLKAEMSASSDGPCSPVRNRPPSASRRPSSAQRDRAPSLVDRAPSVNRHSKSAAEAKEAAESSKRGARRAVGRVVGAKSSQPNGGKRQKSQVAAAATEARPATAQGRAVVTGKRQPQWHDGHHRDERLASAGTEAGADAWMASAVSSAVSKSLANAQAARTSQQQPRQQEQEQRHAQWNDAHHHDAINPTAAGSAQVRPGLVASTSGASSSNVSSPRSLFGKNRRPSSTAAAPNTTTTTTAAAAVPPSSDRRSRRAPSSPMSLSKHGAGSGPVPQPLQLPDADSGSVPPPQQLLNADGTLHRQLFSSPPQPATENVQPPHAMTMGSVHVQPPLQQEQDHRHPQWHDGHHYNDHDGANAPLQSDLQPPVPDTQAAEHQWASHQPEEHHQRHAQWSDVHHHDVIDPTTAGPEPTSS